MTTRITVDHLARVEGDGGITVELDGDAVGRVQFDIFEGPRLLEGLLRGRRFDEVAPIISRICAICSCAHAVTSLRATEHAFGITPSAQAEVLRDLVLRGENIESHALHLFMLAVPDYLGYPSAIAMAAEHRDVVNLALRLKQLGNTIQEILAGRAVHPVNLVLGGFASLPTTDQLLRLQAVLERGIHDMADAAEFVASLEQPALCRAETPYAALDVPGAYGYARGDDIIIQARGRREVFPVTAYRTMAAEHTVPHSHAKHSRWDGTPFTVGALARLAVSGAKLDGAAAALAARLALRPPFEDPLDNNKAQAVELVFDLAHARETVERLLRDGVTPERPPDVVPRAGTGTAATEAPRGLLIHSYTYDAAGMVTAADVVTPTALNAASVEYRLRRAVEQSAERDAETLTPRLEMIVRAYDPCISCAVHVLRLDHAT